ncbi:11168_t:CDS:2 [Gigaspora margarita]|uniref:11168_t:CDS:1 n=1 Tax=Gigaspora margarita TaxID=4874 RepID=A0ABN7UXI0_GIGMA|nr:11168_t:CDS:2 [Gigaspora margarita]
MNFTINRAFHVSPFNDRKGIYKVFCKNPKSGYLDMRLVMYTDPSHPDDVSSENVTYKNNTPIQRYRKKSVATASGHSYSLNLLSVIYAIMTFPLEILLAMPRILKEAYKLHYYKNLGIYRPIPIEGTVVKLDPNFIDSQKAWDCNDLPALIDLLFNHFSIIEDDLKDKCDNSIHRDNKQRLNSYESKTAMIRRWYWKKILDYENSQEFDEILHSLWPAEDVDQDFITIKNNENKLLALFGYTHLYLLTIPSNNSIKYLQPLISHRLHLLPFPPRYIPYEGKEPIVHLIDRFVFLDNYSTFKKRWEWEKIKYLLMVGLMACEYRTDVKFWKLTTRFIDGPNGNPFLGEKWLWEGVIKLLKSKKDYEKEFCKIDNKEKKEKENRTFLEGWDVVYEKKGNIFRFLNVNF